MKLIKEIEDQRIEEGFAKKTYRFRIPAEVHVAVYFFGRHPGDEEEHDYNFSGAEIEHLVRLMQSNDEEQIEKILSANEWEVANVMSMVAAGVGGAPGMIDIAAFDHLGLTAEEYFLGVAGTQQKAKDALAVMLKKYEVIDDDY